MLAQMPRGQLLGLSKYDRIMVYLFRRLTANMTPASLPLEIEFDQEDVRLAMRHAVADGVIDSEVANVPDIKYTYDARRELPQEVEQCGPMTWLQRGKGLYKLRRTLRKNIIDPTQLGNPPLEIVADQTTPFISALLGNDEQAVFTRVRNIDLLSTVLGFKVWPIQGHHRTTVSYGQIEIDEVQAGIDGNRHTLVPISGKGGQDKLSWSQALNLNTYALEKPPMPGLAVRSIGLWRDNLNTIWIVEFSPHVDIDQIHIVNVRRYKFQ
ncbi:hypothetical protein [Paraburkholderia kururiensis]|uniref:Uncharacterized protein n=1 Tax=Paraburkholderia kururiensis TaxID=984307 RepID=A0ABZ0WFD4_9BURK|nr:hypothetical protein [Paraburkholderia kururiensis]WQD76066.1 hypothetical protein U0042_18325 [Paraburkholderia kururiensis]